MTSGLSANGWTPSSALHVRRKKEIALFSSAFRLRRRAARLQPPPKGKRGSTPRLLPGCGAEGYDRLGVGDTVNVAIEQAADQELKLLQQRRAMAPTWSVPSDKVQSDSERSSMLQECHMSDREGSHRLINPHPQSGKGIKK